MRIMSKGYITAIVATGLAFMSAPALAMNKLEVQAPATVHQSETLKKIPDQAEEAFTSSKKKAAFVTEPLNNDKQAPATIHQEEVIADYDDARDDDKKRVN